ncbi:MAG: (Fe-S)-binding protein [Desulfomonilaceae bacterium]
MSNTKIDNEKMESSSEKINPINIEDCMLCGQCISRCFLHSAYPDINPRRLIRKVALGKAQEMADSEFIWACTLCGRCTTDCPKNLKMDTIIREVRGIAWTQDKAPARIKEGIEKGKEFGNNVGMDGEEFVDTIQWLAEELEDEDIELPEGALEIPFDVADSEIFYVPNPREYTSNPNMFQTYAKFFAYTGANWTMSSKVFDITNWPYYMGDQQDAEELIRRMVDETKNLGAKILLSTECGHGFKILRKDAEKWLNEKFDFEVLSIVELAHRYWKQGIIKLSEGILDKKITYHDPCNVGRKVGVFEGPREILKHISSSFIEMWPNRKHSVCCGGGGSVGQNSDMGTKRLEHAIYKRDQILRTGADVVATSCQNCLAQLNDLQSRYEMPIEIKSVIELVVEAIELEQEQLHED